MSLPIVPMHAQINFVENPEVFWLKKISEIKKFATNKTHIKPKDFNDFDKDHIYFTKANCNENCSDSFHDHAIYSESHIIKLVDVETEMQNDLEQDALDKRSARIKKPKVIHDLGSLTPTRSSALKKSTKNKTKEKVGQIFARSKSLLESLGKEKHSHVLLQGGKECGMKENTFSIHGNKEKSLPLSEHLSRKSSPLQTNNNARVVLQKLSPNTIHGHRNSRINAGYNTDNVPEPLHTPTHERSHTPPSLYDNFESFDDPLSYNNKGTHSYDRSRSRQPRFNHRSSNESSRSRSRSRSRSHSASDSNRSHSTTPIYSRGRLTRGVSHEQSSQSPRHSKERAGSRSRVVSREVEDQRYSSRSENNSCESPGRRYGGEPENNADLRRIQEVFGNNQSAIVDFKGRGETRKFVTASIDYYYLTTEGKKEKKSRYKHDPDTNLVYLGEDVYVNSTSWLLLQNDEPEEFIRTVAVYIWKTPAILANRALQLSRVQKNLPNRSPTKRIEKTKLRLLISLLDDFLENKKNISFDRKLKSMLNVTVTLSLKIRDCKQEILKAHEKQLAKQAKRSAKRRLDLIR